MSQQADLKRLCAELDRVGATPLQRRMAVILDALNGLENALAFAAKVPELNAPDQEPAATMNTWGGPPDRPNYTTRRTPC